MAFAARQLAALMVGGLVACNAILGNADSIDYVDGDALAPPRPRDDATSDAFSDAETAEAAPQMDAGVPDTDIPCEAAAFCSDFDPPSDLVPWGWQNASPSNGPQFALEKTHFVTPPNSLRISLLSASDNAHFLNQSIDRARPFTVMFDVRVLARANAVANLLRVSCRVSTNIFANIDSSGRFELADGSKFLPGPNVPLDQWLRLVLTITATTTTLTVLGSPPTTISLARSCLGPFDISLGIVSAQSFPWNVLFDRVRVTAP